MGFKPRLTPELLERLRQTGIRLDRRGRFWHEGAEVTHPGFRRALFRWLDVLDDGRPVFRLDARRFAYVDVEDAHMQALSLHWAGDRGFVTLSDGRREELAYDTLTLGEDDAIYCAVRDGRLEARLSTAAQNALADHITESTSAETNPTETGFTLSACGTSFPIRLRRTDRAGSSP